MKSDFLITKLNESEIEPYLNHIAKNAASAGIEYPPERIEVFRKLLHKFIEKPNSGKALVIYADNKIVGSAMCDYFCDKTKRGANRQACEIMGVYIDEKFRGNGLAKLMLRELLDLAEADCWRAILYARGELAKNLYQKFGFEPLTPPEYNGREVLELEFAAAEING